MCLCVFSSGLGEDEWGGAGGGGGGGLWGGGRADFHRQYSLH